MDDLIFGLLQLFGGLLASPFIAGLLCGLAALYSVGSGWPASATSALGLAWAGLWAFAL